MKNIRTTRSLLLLKLHHSVTVTLDKLLVLSEPQFCPLHNEDSRIISVLLGFS